MKPTPKWEPIMPEPMTTSDAVSLVTFMEKGVLASIDHEYDSLSDYVKRRSGATLEDREWNRVVSLYANAIEKSISEFGCTVTNRGVLFMPLDQVEHRETIRETILAVDLDQYMPDENP